MGQPHKHAEVIKAWADGKTVQMACSGQSTAGGWLDLPNTQAGNMPAFIPSLTYRVKPEPDPYEHLRQALREGKTLECRADLRCSAPKWREVNGGDARDPEREFLLPPKCYRVKPDPYEHLRQAIREGKTVQFQSSLDDRWLPMFTSNPDVRFSDLPHRYRVKPEPLETPITIGLPAMWAPHQVEPCVLNIKLTHVEGEITNIELVSWEK